MYIVGEYARAVQLRNARIIENNRCSILFVESKQVIQNVSFDHVP